ncbi:MAG: TatD family hydrolase [Chloroflexia bacterium]
MQGPNAPSFFDTHTHLNTEAFAADLSEVLARARSAGVDRMLVVGFDLPSSRAAVALAREPGLYAAVGIQPHYAGETGVQELEMLRSLASSPGVVALGEIGLDYYRDRAPRPAQRELFRRQLDLARELGLPVVIHARDALGDLLEELRRAGAGSRGVMHCFSGTPQEARAFLELGLCLSIAGPVTYPRATRLAEVVRLVPRDRLLLETDCPWLPPQRHRGTRNEPAYLVEIAEQVAALRGEPVEELARATTQNARALFHV